MLTSSLVPTMNCPISRSPSQVVEAACLSNLEFRLCRLEMVALWFWFVLIASLARWLHYRFQQWPWPILLSFLGCWPNDALFVVAAPTEWMECQACSFETSWYGCSIPGILASILGQRRPQLRHQQDKCLHKLQSSFWRMLSSEGQQSSFGRIDRWSSSWEMCILLRSSLLHMCTFRGNQYGTLAWFGCFQVCTRPQMPWRS